MRLHAKRTLLWVVCLFFTGLVFINVYKGTDSWHGDISKDTSRNEKRGLEEEPYRQILLPDVLRLDGKQLYTPTPSGVRKTLNISNHSTVFKSGTILIDFTYIQHHQTDRIWPDKQFDWDDRIEAQLKYSQKSDKRYKLKKILLHQGFGGIPVKPGQTSFLEQKCPVSSCTLTENHQESADADLIIFRHMANRITSVRPPKQIWLLYILESPYHTPSYSAFSNVFNWTATYRHDSTIVTPYEKFVPFNSSVLVKHQGRDYSVGKTKQVAWFVSNCGARNQRLKYAQELKEFIGVDIYGACGKLSCPRHVPKCFNMLNTDYKFYLAFENSNCRDYITEKFFFNGLQHDVIPIVMGAAPEDYRRVSPPHSFIHVDDFESPSALADYLHILDKNPDLYNEYFRWKGTGSFINTFFWCRLCAMVHAADSHSSSSYSALDDWWRGPGVCITGPWRNFATNVHQSKSIR